MTFELIAASGSLLVFCSSLEAGGDGSTGLPVAPAGKEGGGGHEGAEGTQ